MAKTDGPRLSIVAQSQDSAEITIYGDIDPYYGVSAKEVRDALKAIGKVKDLAVRINSAGGSIFEGLAIYALLAEHPATITVKVDGIALSMASVIAMAGDVIEAAENAFIMIHNPVSAAYGESDALRHWAEVLDKLKTQLVAIYAKRTKQETAKIGELMDAETWFTAAEAVEFGLADRVTDQLALAASFDARRFDHVPDGVPGRAKPKNGDSEVTQDTNAGSAPATFAELKAALPKASAEFIVKMLDRQATLDTARSEYTAELEQRAANAEAAAEKAKTDAAAEAAKAKADADASKSGKKLSGVDVLPDGKDKGEGEPTGDAVDEFNAAVEKKMATGLERLKAVKAVASSNPDLHQAYLAATNPGRRAKRLLEEKYEDD